jgi:signal transduction histidine kinase
MHRPLAAERHVSLHFQPDDALPLVPCDEEEFSRVVQNLLENALNFTPDGGQVFVKTYARDDQAVLEVSDTGIGITPADLPHIFERFFRADKARQAHTGGAGLGLSIAQRIVEAHEGRITVTSTPGSGTTFCVLVPFRRAEPRILPAQVAP